VKKENSKRQKEGPKGGTCFGQIVVKSGLGKGDAREKNREKLRAGGGSGQGTENEKKYLEKGRVCLGAGGWVMFVGNWRKKNQGAR